MNDSNKILDDSIQKIKNNINNDTLSNEFKENLIKKMKEEENKKVEKKNLNKNNLSIYKKIIPVLACLVLIITTGSLADDFENIILNHFSNIDQITKKAIENGEIEYVDGEFIEDQGISIRTNYIIKKDNNLYIAIEIKDRNKFEQIKICEIFVIDGEKQTQYEYTGLPPKVGWQTFYSINKGIIIKVSNLEKMNNMQITVNKIEIDNNTIFGNWRIF